MRTCIQLDCGGMMCCRTVPYVDSSDRMKLTAEGGKPQTVTQVSRGELSGAMETSWGEVMVDGGDTKLLWMLLVVENEIFLFGVNRRELVGGPLACPLWSGLERSSLSAVVVLEGNVRGGEFEG